MHSQKIQFSVFPSRPKGKLAAVSTVDELIPVDTRRPTAKKAATASSHNSQSLSLLRYSDLIICAIIQNTLFIKLDDVYRATKQAPGGYYSTN